MPLLPALTVFLSVSGVTIGYSINSTVNPIAFFIFADPIALKVNVIPSAKVCAALIVKV